MRYFIEFSYKGTHYHGWQIQENANSVQNEINKALKIIFRTEIETFGSGRTDTGVHACQQFLHFDVEIAIADIRDFIYKINTLLPHDIAIYKIVEVKPDHHARFDAVSRSYQYHIHRVKNPFLKEFSYFFPHLLDVDLMNSAAGKLIGEKDFSSFSKTHTDVATFICTVTEAYWKVNEGKITFHISANRFLRGMVRAIVGTLLDVGLKKTSLSEFEEIIESKNRKNAGRNVPAEGLFLTQIKYKSEIEYLINLI